MEITASQVKELRELTGAGMMEAKQALVEAAGDFAKAQELLRKRGAEIAGKKSSRNASEGIVVSYIHGTKLGVLLELNCETDFVAKNEDFKRVAQELALQVAGLNPLYVDRSEIPEEELNTMKSEWAAEVKGKPLDVTEKIIQGKLDKYCSEVCLMDQTFFRDETKTVRDVVNDLVGIIKENIKVGRFVRMPMGHTVRVAEALISSTDGSQE
jgi:elongation factor Ts